MPRTKCVMSVSSDRSCSERRHAGSRGEEAVAWLCRMWSIVALTLSLLVTPDIAATQPRDHIPLVAVLSPATPEAGAPQPSIFATTSGTSAPRSWP